MKLKWDSQTRQNCSAEYDSNFSPVLKSALSFLGAMTINLDLNKLPFVSDLSAKQHQQLVLQLQVSPEGEQLGVSGVKVLREKVWIKKEKKGLPLLSFQSLISLGPQGGIFQHEPASILSYKQVIYLAL